MNISTNGNVDLSIKKFVEESNYDPLLKGDIVFNNTNSPELVGKTTWIKQDTNWAYSNHMTKIRIDTTQLDPAWIAYFLHTQYLQGYFKMRCTHHVNQASVNSSYLSQHVYIPLPPLTEQHRIVTKIEELFTQLDAGVASLKKVQAQLKQYRQAVLKAAFEGRLTQEWREKHNEEISKDCERIKKIIEVRFNKISRNKRSFAEFNSLKLLPLQKNWEWTRLDFVCNKIQDGMHFSPPEQFDQPAKGRYPYVTAKNIKDSGIDLTNITYINENYHQDIFKRCNPEFGDVLLIKDGVTTGVVCVNQLKGEFSLLSSVALLKPDNELLNPYYLKYYLASPQGLSMILGQMTGVAIKRIILEKIKKSPIILPPLFEQKRIVSEIEERLSIVDAVDKGITASLRQAEYLRQSILKQAFEGRLVPQDPNDEPASVLLERIRAEKAQQQTKIKSPKTSKRINKNAR